ncbi:alpha-amylase [Microbacterium sp. Y-01]|uniref:glycoside hydrolase family 13 protein n=1 Tax=Microbacterium sp. Y-01 TaxID=2048898 RepID=UPI000F5E64F4|nr:glycoside hydrolase family 13 protein [Microbacterium sp. Y-01]AZH79320.1 alpha-amylase [Microbacterium sp. Y-01]
MTSTSGNNQNPSAEPHLLPAADWWRRAVIYQIYPRSFGDASGDGIGDLPGITERLDHLERLGVDAVWLSPFYPSPQNDAGYDVSDFCGVDPLFGTIEDFRELLERAHAQGIRVIIDLVPNHSSNEHPWFRAALAAAPHSPERNRYIFRTGRGASGDVAPNNWESVFAGPAWTRVGDSDQWYLHLFDSSQPDFNWSNADVRDLFDGVLRFWLDLGVDGFRVDVARGLVKAADFPDYPVEYQHAHGFAPDGTRSPMWDNDGVHEIFRRWRSIVDEYDGERILVAEAYVEPVSRLARYVRPDEMHQAFNFAFLAAVGAAEIRDVIDESLREYGHVGAPSTWVLNNHDNVRHVSRLGSANPRIPNGVGIGPRDLQPDHEVGLRRARAVSALMLALPGSVYIYQGEELGLPEHTTLEDRHRQDPTWYRSAGTIAGRDGSRVPLPWIADAPAFGFSPTGASWLPQPSTWREIAADVQRHDPDSTLSLYQSAIEIRHRQELGDASLRWLDSEGDVLRFAVGPIEVLANLGEEPCPLPAGHIVLASADIADAQIPAQTTVWLLRDASAVEREEEKK